PWIRCGVRPPGGHGDGRRAGRDGGAGTLGREARGHRRRCGDSSGCRERGTGHDGGPCRAVGQAEGPAALAEMNAHSSSGGGGGGGGRNARISAATSSLLTPAAWSWLASASGSFGAGARFGG